MKKSYVFILYISGGHKRRALCFVCSKIKCTCRGSYSSTGPVKNTNRVLQLSHFIATIFLYVTSE
jgi:hypothetical protein